MKQTQTWLFAILVAAATLSRLIDHPWNFAPVGALALFAGAYCRNRWLAISVPLAVMAVSDIAIGVLRHDMVFYSFHQMVPVIYGCFLVNVLLGSGVRWFWKASEKRNQTDLSVQGGVTAQVPSTAETNLARALPVAAAALIGVVVFFLVTNFAMWALYNTYPKTWDGLVACYVAGIPFIRNQLVGDVFYAVVLFGGYELMKQRMPATEEAGLLYR